MAGLADELRRAQAAATSGLERVVTPLRYAFLDRPEEEQIPSDRASMFWHDVTHRKYKHDRHGRFSPSGLAHCRRRQVFSFMGLEQLPDTPEMAEMARQGTEVHTGWQVDGLTHPYLSDAEVWVSEPSLFTSGSLDGLVIDGSIFELKSITGVAFDRVRRDEIRMAWRLQLAIYFLLAESAGFDHHDRASLVLVTRDFGGMHEWRLERKIADERLALGVIEDLLRHIQADQLPPQLENCKFQQKSDRTYAQCPYREVCPLYSAVSQAPKVADGTVVMP